MENSERLEGLDMINEDEKQSFIDEFIDEVKTEYGRPLPPELSSALQSFSYGLSFENGFDIDQALDESEELRGLSLFPEVVSALKRAASRCNRDSSNPPPQPRSTVSSLSDTSKTNLFGGISVKGDVEIHAKDATRSSLDLARKDSRSSTSEESAKSSPSTSATPPRPPDRSHSAQSTHSQSSQHSVTVNRNLGPNILKELQKVYHEEIPQELVFVLKHSVTIPYSMNSDEDLSIIIRECESLCGMTLHADMILAVREASVNLRAPSGSVRSRRSRLIRQGSGSFRSTSRSSGMPSIKESDDNNIGASDQSQPVFVPGEISTGPARRRGSRIPRHVRRTDSVDPGLPVPGLEKAGFESFDARSAGSASDEGSIDQSISLDSIQLAVGGKSPPVASPRQFLNESESTQLVSNLPRPNGRLASNLQLELDTIHGSIDEYSEPWGDESEQNLDISNSKSFDMVETYDSASSLGTGGVSSYSLGTNEDGECSSTPAVSIVSKASTLPTKRLPRGVDTTPPVEGVESDDLNAIFKAAAKQIL
jgi:hypothetical protein